jgi:ACR3 family arsenite efflux pump ArsB
MILQSILYPLLADMSVEVMFNVGEEAKKVLILFQYAISSIFFMIGLILLFLRDVDKKYAKRILLAFLISYIPGFLGFYNLATSPLTNAGIVDFTPDIIMVALALITYIKPKDN